jgi:catechol 2,3-dioxygenase-like lactoylglutathione lyase family enzyme
MAPFTVKRAGAILAVGDVDRSLAFYRDVIGFAVEATYDDPPYATLTLAGTRLSLAEQGHTAEDRPDVEMSVPENPSKAAVVVVVEVEDARAVYAELQGKGARFLAEPYEPPWGGCRFFCIDPDGYLVEIEQPA